VSRGRLRRVRRKILAVHLEANEPADWRCLLSDSSHSHLLEHAQRSRVLRERARHDPSQTGVETVPHHRSGCLRREATTPRMPHKRVCNFRLATPLFRNRPVSRSSTRYVTQPSADGRASVRFSQSSLMARVRGVAAPVLPSTTNGSRLSTTRSSRSPSWSGRKRRREVRMSMPPSTNGTKARAAGLSPPARSRAR
jgi:hypothetical protein